MTLEMIYDQRITNEATPWQCTECYPLGQDISGLDPLGWDGYNVSGGAGQSKHAVQGHQNMNALYGCTSQECYCDQPVNDSVFTGFREEERSVFGGSDSQNADRWVCMAPMGSIVNNGRGYFCDIGYRFADNAYSGTSPFHDFQETLYTLPGDYRAVGCLYDNELAFQSFRPENVITQDSDITAIWETFVDGNTGHNNNGQGSYARITSSQSSENKSKVLDYLGDHVCNNRMSKELCSKYNISDPITGNVPDYCPAYLNPNFHCNELSDAKQATAIVETCNRPELKDTGFCSCVNRTDDPVYQELIDAVGSVPAACWWKGCQGDTSRILISPDDREVQQNCPDVCQIINDFINSGSGNIEIGQIEQSVSCTFNGDGGGGDGGVIDTPGSGTDTPTNEEEQDEGFFSGLITTATDNLLWTGLIVVAIVVIIIIIVIVSTSSSSDSSPGSSGPPVSTSGPPGSSGPSTNISGPPVSTSGPKLFD